MNRSAQIIGLYRRLFTGRRFYSFNRALFFLSLRGLGIGNWETPELSGERHFIDRFTRFSKSPVVLDIGANVGNYSNLLKELAPNARIFAFEPHPLTFDRLQKAAGENSYVAVNAAVGAAEATAQLYDHGGKSGEHGTEHASMFKDVIESVHSNKSAAWDVRVTTVDNFVRENQLRHIDLLKIDVEGGEMNVLLGASDTLRGEMIDIIHFEFTEANTVSRVFMKDFYEVLPNFDFYRMLSDGLAPMGPYFPQFSEIFAYQNVVAVRKDVTGWN